MRELTGGIYFGEKTRDADSALATSASTPARRSSASPGSASRRAGRRDGRLTSVDKANVLETSRLWREVVTEVHGDYPDIALDHMLVDNAAMQLIADPSRFDVIVTENMFGDILSDEAAMLTGSLGMLPSASLGDERARSSSSRSTAPRPTSPARAPRTRWRVPLGGMLLRDGLGADDEATRVEAAVDAALESGARTADLAGGGEAEGVVGTDEMTQAVLKSL